MKGRIKMARRKRKSSKRVVVSKSGRRYVKSAKSRTGWKLVGKKKRAKKRGRRKASRRGRKTTRRRRSSFFL